MYSGPCLPNSRTVIYLARVSGLPDVPAEGRSIPTGSCERLLIGQYGKPNQGTHPSCNYPRRQIPLQGILGVGISLGGSAWHGVFGGSRVSGKRVRLSLLLSEEGGCLGVSPENPESAELS